MPSARKLGKRADQRRAMFRGMVTLLLDKGRIETTLFRAKELKRVTDKMITTGKKNTLAARRAAMAYITKEDVVKKLFDRIAPSFEDRKGGYTRVLKLGPRRGDGAEMAIIELVNYTPKAKDKDKSKKAKDAKEDNKEEKIESKKEAPKEEKKEDLKEAKKPVKKTKAAEKIEVIEAEVVEEVEVAEEIEEVEEVAEEEETEETEEVEESEEAEEAEEKTEE